MAAGDNQTNAVISFDDLFDGRCGGSGNFANDRERASEAGRKGGQH
ncbi:general stress protein [Bosea vaviloviae]